MNWLQRFRRSNAHTQANIVCTFVIMCATVAYTITAWRQLDVMRDTLTQMKQTGEQSAQQTWSAIGNINWLARSMDWSQKTTQEGIQASERQSESALLSAQEQMRLDQRAWVGVDPESLTDPRFPEKLRIINSGKTPALNFKLIRNEIVSALPKDPVPTLDERTYNKERWDGWWKAMEKAISRHPADRERLEKIARDEAAEIKAEENADDAKEREAERATWGNDLAPGIPQEISLPRVPTAPGLVIYFLGELTYRDIFLGTKVHTTTYCLMKSPDGQLDYCPVGNKMD